MKLQLINNKKVTKLRSSRPDSFCKKGVVRNFAKFTRKHLYQGLFLMAHVFSCEFCEISKNPFSYRTSKVAASENGIKHKKATKTECFSCSINTMLE